MSRRKTQQMDAELEAETPANESAEVSDSPDLHEEIAQVAYAMWEERGYMHGSHEEDWRRAEEIVRRKRASGDA